MGAIKPSPLSCSSTASLPVMFGRTRWERYTSCRAMVRALHGDGRPRRRAVEMGGVALMPVRRALERRNVEFVGVQERVRLVVFVVEEGSRFSKRVPRRVAKGRARSEITHAEAC